MQDRVNADSQDKHLINYLLVLWPFSSYGLGVEAVSQPVGPRVDAPVPFAGNFSAIL